MSPRLDFAAVSQAALNHLADLVQEIDPGAKLTGEEWTFLDPKRPSKRRGDSKINRRTGKWGDFASGEGGGDVVSWWAHCRGLEQGAAARELAGRFGEVDPAGTGPQGDSKHGEAVSPVPGNAPSPDWAAMGNPLRWAYRDAEGRLLRWHVRFDDAKGKKFTPLTWRRQKNGSEGWRMAKLEDPQPLYGLDRLASQPAARVLLVEGEKAADAAQVLFTDLAVVTSGGATSAAKADWAPLQGREVMIWPDADKPGATYASNAAKLILESGAREVRIVQLPEGLPEGWDLADAAPEGLDPRALLGSSAPAVGSRERATHEGRPRVRRFSWTDRGLWYQPQSDGAEEKSPIFVAPPFRILGLSRDARGDSWRMILGWSDPDGTPHDADVPFELIAGEGAELGKVLGQGGLALPPDPAPRKHLLRYLYQAYPQVRDRIRLVQSLGWNGGQFVLAGEVLGAGIEVLRYAGNALPPFSAHTAGTFEGWSERVAALAIGNPRLAFAIACAFAGPLLTITRKHGSGGFNLLGESSRGKSTCLEGAASVWGCPNPLPTWKATQAGLEGTAHGHQDAFLPLDELSQCDAREAGQMAYLLANGAGKSRADRGGDARAIKRWQLIFLSTGEQGLEDKLSEDGKRVRAGQEVRCPDIPCPGGLFEDPRGHSDFAELADQLRAGARAHYGHAGRRFVEELARVHARWDELRAGLASREAAWIAQRFPFAVDGQVRRVASRFALVGLAGELARGYGILPWPEGFSLESAAICFEAWRARRGHDGASEFARSLAGVVAFLEANGLGRFAIESETMTHAQNVAGIRQKTEMGEWDYILHQTGWQEACKGYDPRSTARAALEVGLLESDKDGRPTQKKRLPLLGQGRFYVIRAEAIAAFRERGVA